MWQLGGGPLVQRRLPKASEGAAYEDRVRPAASNRCCRAGSSLVTGGAIALRSPADSLSGAASALAGFKVAPRQPRTPGS